MSAGSSSPHPSWEGVSYPGQQRKLWSQAAGLEIWTPSLTSSLTLDNSLCYFLISRNGGEMISWVEVRAEAVPTTP